MLRYMHLCCAANGNIGGGSILLISYKIYEYENN